MAAAAAAQLTDEELFSELRRLGFSPGPVTESTRPVYLKKLKKLRDEERAGGARGAAASKTRNSNNNNPGRGGGGDLATRLANADLFSPPGAGAAGGGSGRARTAPGAGGKVLLGFSSDESDAEAGPRGQAGAAGSRRERGSASRRDPRPAAAALGAACLHNSALAEAPARRKPSAWWGASAARRQTVTAGAREQTPGRRELEGCGEKEEEEGGGGGGDAAAAAAEEQLQQERCKNRAVNGSRFLSYGSGGGASRREKYSDSEEEGEEEKGTRQQMLKETPLAQHYLARRSLGKSAAPFIVHKRAMAGDEVMESALEQGPAGVVLVNDKMLEEGNMDFGSSGEKGVVKVAAAAGTDSEYLDSSSQLPRCRYNSSKKTQKLLSPPLLTDFYDGKMTDSLGFSRKPLSNHGLISAVGGSSIEPRTYTATSPGATISSSTTMNHSNHTDSNHTYLKNTHKQNLSEPEDDLLQQFKREEVSTTGGFSAHYLSMFLLSAACLFFLILGLTYLRMRGSGVAEDEGADRKYQDMW
ncbi:hypothetical protein lerEdw1_020712 [Lerista edwardsae]|nr:hypothetical protein lerEdw1_020712 [Lerista edwardsae]